jgi:HEAT repeat protein
MRGLVIVVLAAGWAAGAGAQDLKQKLRTVKDLAKDGVAGIAPLTAFLQDPEVEVRREAVKALAGAGSQRAADPLTLATRDLDPEIQVRATDGLVNFYLPGYARTGLSAQLSKAGALISPVFDDRSDWAVDPGTTVRTEIGEALARLVQAGATAGVRANAARAAGALRAKPAFPALVEALRSKDDQIIHEALIALQKIGDRGAGPRVVFLLRDLSPRIQTAAIETAGLLGAKEAVADLRRILNTGSDRKVKRAALSALAMIPDSGNRPWFDRFLGDEDENLRAGAAEGLARMNEAQDRPRVEALFEKEKKMAARLALAFAAAALGGLEMSEFAPLRYLVNSLNSKAWRGVAQAYLEELGRREDVRKALLLSFQGATTREEKSGLVFVFGRSGGAEALPVLESLARDPDAELAQEVLRALRLVRARTARN